MNPPDSCPPAPTLGRGRAQLLAQLKKRKEAAAAAAAAASAAAGIQSMTVTAGGDRVSPSTAETTFMTVSLLFFPSNTISQPYLKKF